MSKTTASSRFSGLQFGSITSTDHPMFEPAFGLFSSLFTHHGELFMDRGMFQKVFALNEDDAFQSRWGPARLTLAYAYNPVADRVVGGTGFTSMVLPGQLAQECGFDAACIGSHLFVDRSCRKDGLAMRLVDEREKLLREFAVLSRPSLGDSSKVRLIAFNEQLDPRLMSLEDIREDIESSGTHPCDRVLSSRTKAGWRAVDARFRYVEIDRPGDPGIDTMILNVKGAGTLPPPAMLPTSLLCRFLEVYAAVRRFGEDPYKDPVFHDQIRQAKALQIVMPADDSDYIRNLRPLIDAQLKSEQQPAASAACDESHITRQFNRTHEKICAKRRNMHSGSSEPLSRFWRQKQLRMEKRLERLAR